MTYFDMIRKQLDRAESAKPFAVSKFSSFADVPNLEANAVYIIKDLGDPAITFKAFEEYKESSSNAVPKTNVPSQVMYVGSSTTGVTKRLKQHLVSSPKGTYALRLPEWFTGEYEIEIRLYDEPREIVQMIEDALSHELKPAFGKSGSNNK